MSAAVNALPVSTLSIVIGEPTNMGRICKRYPRATLRQLESTIAKYQKMEAPRSFEEYSALHAAAGAGDEAAKKRVDALKANTWFVCGEFGNSDTRKSGNCLSASALVLDVDQPGASYDALVASLDGLGCAYLLTTSTSHGVGGRERYRLVIPFRDPMPKAEIEAGRYKAAWARINELLGGVCDGGATDGGTRLNYLPWKLPGAPRPHTVHVVDDRPGFDWLAVELPESVCTPAANDADGGAIDVPAMLERGKDDAKFLALWDGDIEAAGISDRSKADSLLVKMIVYYGQSTDPDAIDTAARESQMYRDEWDSSGHSGGFIKYTVERFLAGKCGGAYEPPGGLPIGDDEVENYSDVGTDAAGAEGAAEGVKTGESAASSGFEFVSMWQLVDQPPAPWLVQGMLQRADLGMIYGAPGSGKSFLALDLALHMARGVEWHGRPVVASRVAWIAAEASGSFGVRVKAFAKRHGLDRADCDIPVLAAAPDFGNPAHVKQIIAGVQAAGAEVLFVDTLAAVSGGVDENSSEIGKVIGGCQQIHRATGAFVVVIHHSGKDATRGARGWSGINAAMHSAWEVERLDDGAPDRVVTVRKLRDGEDGGKMGFRLERVEVSELIDDEVVASCVVEPAEVAARAPHQKLGPHQRAVMDALQELQDEASGIEPVGIALEALLTRAAEKIVHDPAKDDRRREYAIRAVNALVGRGMLAADAGKVHRAN